MASTPFKLRSQGSSFKMMGSSPAKEIDKWTATNKDLSSIRDNLLADRRVLIGKGIDTGNPNRDKNTQELIQVENDIREHKMKKSKEEELKDNKPSQYSTRPWQD